jgi:hypothetical protein
MGFIRSTCTTLPGQRDAKLFGHPAPAARFGRGELGQRGAEADHRAGPSPRSGVADRNLRDVGAQDENDGKA